MVYGRPPPSILRFVPGEIHCEAVAQDLLDRDEALRQLKYHLSRAQERMKKSADKHRRDVEFAVGDWVFLKLRPHRQHSAVKRINQKLSARFYGPFMIIGRVGQVAYKLQLPETSRIHPVFHVSLLKRAVGTQPIEPTLPPGLEVEDSPHPFPERCLATREITDRGKPIQQWLIQWQGGAAEDATWEDTFTIQSQFPQFRLEDKPVSQAAGTDKDRNIPGDTQGWIVYSRRNHKQGQVSSS